MSDYLLLDTDGEPFEPDAVYSDRYGDVWRYLSLGDGHEGYFLHIKAVTETAPAQGPAITRWCETARSADRDFGPMAKTRGEAA